MACGGGVDRLVPGVECMGGGGGTGRVKEGVWGRVPLALSKDSMPN